MSGAVSRDLTEVRRRFLEWFAAQRSVEGEDARDLDATVTAHTAGGYSNEILFVTMTYRVGDEWRRPRLVLRLPPAGPRLFPTYDLAMQVSVQAGVAAHGVPVPSPITLESDERWLGTPFLVMPRIEGNNPGELPVADEWVASATPGQQRSLHEGFLDVLTRIHRVPWRDQHVATGLRGPGSSLLDEVRWWEELTAWAFDGDPPGALTDAFAWCRDHHPADEPPSSVLWGDVRLGNVIFDDEFAPAAVLDWEMASIGPAELDLGWFTALEAMTEHFFGRRVPGFLTRDEVVARHEHALGRPLVDFRWFEVFALCRSSVLNLRADRLDLLPPGQASAPGRGQRRAGLHPRRHRRPQLNDASSVRPSSGWAPVTMLCRVPTPTEPSPASVTRTMQSRCWWMRCATSTSSQRSTCSPSTWSSPRYSPWTWPSKPP